MESTLDIELQENTNEDSLDTTDEWSDSEDDDPDKLRPAGERKRPWPLAPFSFMVLTVQSLGVVYGDLGTSPIYTWPTILTDLGNWTEDDLLGAQCLMTYSLILIVCVKYTIFVMTADNKGEGGILSLVSLIPPRSNHNKKGPKPSWKLRWCKRVSLAIAFVGAAFILGDGAITPAIEVLSAIEGLGVVNTEVVSYQVEIALVLLGLLFLVQSYGSTKIGFSFGPIMLLWFISIGGIGLYDIIMYNPQVLKSFDPRYGYWLFAKDSTIAFNSLGGVVLAITGVEALYADMGHFGKWPIRAGWWFIVFPSVMLSYLGQASYVLYDSSSNTQSNLFFYSIPTGLFWPMIFLSLAATIIASQSLITSTFSLVSQAIALDSFPPMNIKYTDKTFHGQVYLAAPNYILGATTLSLVLFFQNSASLAYAFAIAVTGTLAMTTLIFMTLCIVKWKWSAFVVLPIGFFFFFIEMVFFASNLQKFTSGGWIPLLFALLLVIIMGTWRLGRADVHRYHKQKNRDKSTKELVVSLAEDSQNGRLPGTGVFLATENETVPKSLTAYRKCLGGPALPSRLILVKTRFSELPYLRDGSRISARYLGSDVYKIVVRHGFFEKRSTIEEILQEVEHMGVLKPDPSGSDHTAYFIVRETLRLKQKRRLWTSWRHSIFNFWARIAANPTARNVVLPAKGLVEFYSVLSIEKKFPGNNLVSRFFNKSS